MKEIQVEVCKFPLSEIQEKLLQQMERYMRLNTDVVLKAMSLSEMHLLVAKFQQPFPPNPVTEIRPF